MSHPAGQARFELSGVVQGVGFRPFVHRLATELGLRGIVGNESASVFIEVAGSTDALDRFERRLVSDAPPLAHVAKIERLSSFESLAGCAGFEIVESEGVAGERAELFVSPDVATCDDCLAEMADPTERRYRHPFITCTNCGPRFTIIQELPYDRPRTTMSGFDMCEACKAEYHDPADRRFHAQPIGCHACGPRLSWSGTSEGSSIDPLSAAADCLLNGGVVAIKGLGGYHLAVRADSGTAVSELRQRKHRPDKPFAVMAADIEMVKQLAEVSPQEIELMTSSARPIVLCRSLGSRSPVVEQVAPGNPLVGIMLAYTPVHHLLFAGHELPPLVMTSGNLGGEPIAYDDADAALRLSPLIDGMLTHDRPIHLPCDDSVVRVVGGDPMPIRRARGYAPMPIALPAIEADPGTQTEPEPTVLAVGGELKNAFCLTSGRQAWMSQHIGDMENLETLDAFAATVDRFTAFYEVEPSVVAADSHPAYLSSGWARTNHGDRVVEVQHHHAHVAAVMAEHGLATHESVLGIAFDGTGDGQDGSVWGGELLVADGLYATRVGHLRSVVLPGGDAAVRHPWRVALSHLRCAGVEWSSDLPSVRAAGEGEIALLERQLDRNLNCVQTTSMGRFFDALASLVGLRHDISYEAQAAIELEIAAAKWVGAFPSWTFSLSDPTALLVGVCDAVRKTLPTGAIARGVHEAIADGVASEVLDLAEQHVLSTATLSGGVFQNALLVEGLSNRLRAAGLTVLTHRLVPPNDGGLALGQAYVARARHLANQSNVNTSDHSLAKQKAG